jgi:DNA-binding NarL/FixJ family response regulator
VDLENSARPNAEKAPADIRYRVLIVDDAPTVREALGWVLGDIPELEIVGNASSGAEALASASSMRPHLVILDIQLPDLDGYAVAQQLKQLVSPPRILFLTGQRDPAGAEHAQQAGGDGYIEKSVGWLALLEEIRRLLRDLPLT